MQATISPGGNLRPLEKAYLIIRGRKINFKSIPELSDSKSAEYTDEPIIGRAMPMKTYSHSGNRSIGLELYFYITEDNDVLMNLQDKRTIESAVYPDDGLFGSPYRPPPVCKIRCGDLLATQDLCVVCKQYSVKYPRDVVWEDQTYCPWMFQISTTWEVVYKTSDLPGG